MGSLSECSYMKKPSKLVLLCLNILLPKSDFFRNIEPFRPEVYVAPGLVPSIAPYLVGLIEKENPDIIICAGSLLNYRWVLTLASCTFIKQHDKKRYRIVAPRLDDGSWIRFTIQKIIAHEFFKSSKRKYSEWENKSHDISLIKMNGGLGFIDYVTQPKDWDENFENQIATVREIRKVRRHTGLVTPDEFIERSFHVLPIYQCKE